MSNKCEHYSMDIHWSDEDNVYIVSVPELSGCKTHGGTYKEAIRQAQELIELWVDANEEWERVIPAPRVLVSL